ncbi:MAG: endonuclease domain-containing protein [Hyphomonadaceae bacterium]|nr:endonuclease domain-containing protein [Hyphomonadaceae bacterium]
MRVHRKTRSRAKAMRWPMTRAETILWTRLQRARLMGLHFRKQHPVGPYIADFACVKARLVVEVDGETHWREAERMRDARRTAFLEAEGWTILRVWNADVYSNEEGVVETIGRYAANGIAGRGLPLPADVRPAPSVSRA